MKKAALVFIAVIFSLVLVGCPESQPQVSTSGAKTIDLVKEFKIPKNSNGNTVEQQNILDRYKVTTDPAKVLWIHLIGLDGKIIRRMPVKCKVTSSEKRLEPVTAANSLENFPESPFFQPMSHYNWETSEFIQADGTYGHSDPYIFWFDPMNRYHQWGTAGGLGYLLTDYPIDLKNPMDEITGLYNADKASSDWQKQQEKQLAEKENQK